jgi:hypothetical protein
MVFNATFNNISVISAVHVDSTITESVNGHIKNIQIYSNSKIPQKNNNSINM